MPRATHTPEQVDRVTHLIARGATMGEAGEAVGLNRNAVASILYRLRQKNDPRVTPASPVMTKSRQREAVADAFAAGAVNVEAAARQVGLSTTAAHLRWQEVCAGLGAQAR